MGVAVVGVGAAAVAEVDTVEVAGLETAPKRCCNSSAIRIVALSIADLGR